MDEETYSIAAEAEDTHWWFKGRRKVLSAVIDAFLPASSISKTILEVGCGNGGNYALLSKYGKLFAVEPDDASRARAIQRGLAQVEKGSLPENLPFNEETFDLIAALDVLEHVGDDRKSLDSIRNRLKPDGLLVLTLPAYNFLWTSNDVNSHHKRRYTRSEAISILNENGFRTLFSSYYNCFLFPLALVYVLLDKFLKNDPSRALRIPIGPVNALLEKIFAAESSLIPKMSLPFGVSIIICGKVR